MTPRTATGIIRLALAATGVVALVARFLWAFGSVTFSSDNFFAYLTIQSNIAFVVVMILAGMRALRTGFDPVWLTTARATVLACILVAGIVFALLVQQAGVRAYRIDVPWSDQILHFVLPVLALIEWLAAPGRGRAKPRAVLAALVYPVLWGVVTIIRGPLVGWYPYFFLDPAQVSGFLEFALISALALTLFCTLSAGIVLCTRARPFGERMHQRRHRHRVAEIPLGE